MQSIHASRRTNSTATGRRISGRSRITLALGLAAALVSPALLANNGDLDTSFNGGAFVVAPNGAGFNSPAFTVAIQADGRVLGGGRGLDGNFAYWALMSRNGDGSVDTSFGSGTGEATLAVGARYKDGDRKGAIFDEVIQPDGKIVGVGCAVDKTNAGFKTHTVRWNSDGTLDTTFGNGGNVVSTIAGTGCGEYAALQEDGKIVVATPLETGPTTIEPVILRYTKNGHLDASFGTGGIFRMPPSTPVTELGSPGGLVILPDGGILFAVGQYSPNVEVIKLTSSGILDPSFGSGGIAITPLGISIGIAGLSLQPNGKIVGYTQVDFSNFMVYRLLGNGAMDKSYNKQGWLSVPNFLPSALVVLPTGQALVSGQYEGPEGSTHLAVARITADGVLDNGFSNSAGQSGIVVCAAPDNSNTVVSGIKVQPDGRFVVAGAGGSLYQFLFARFQGDPLRLWPKAFAFTNVSGVPLSTVQVSNVVRISGLTTTARVPIQVVAGSYSINGDPFTTQLGYVRNGDQVMVKHTSAATSHASVTTQLKVGGISDSNNPWLIRGTRAFATFTSTTQ